MARQERLVQCSRHPGNRHCSLLCASSLAFPPAALPAPRNCQIYTCEQICFRHFYLSRLDLFIHLYIYICCADKVPIHRSQRKLHGRCAGRPASPCRSMPSQAELLHRRGLFIKRLLECVPSQRDVSTGAGTNNYRKCPTANTCCNNYAIYIML